MNQEQDSGFAWIVMLNGMFLNALSVLSISSQSILIIYITESLSESYSKVSIITSLLNLFYGGSSLFSGILDRIFTWRQLLMTGSFLLVLCHLASVFVKNVYLLYITLGVLNGLGLNTFTFCSGVSVASWFNKRKSLALACISVGTSVGFLIWGPITNLIIDNYGWRSAILLIGAIYAHGLVNSFIIRASAQVKTDKVTNENSNDSSKTQPRRKIFDVKIFKNPALVVLFISIIATFIGHMLPFFWIPTRTKHSEVGLRKGIFIVSTLAGTSIVFRFIIGFLGDKPWFNRMIIFSLSQGISGLLSICSCFYHSFFFLLCYGFLFGISSCKMKKLTNTSQ